MRSDFTAFRYCSEITDKQIGSRYSHIKAQNFQNQVLHSQNLTNTICIVGDVSELRNIRRVDFFVFPATKTLKLIKIKNI